MSVYFKCDRCGKPAESAGSKTSQRVTVHNWKGDGSLAWPPRKVQLLVKFEIFGRELDFGDDISFDLCNNCTAEIVTEAGVELDKPPTQSTPAV